MLIRPAHPQTVSTALYGSKPVLTPNPSITVKGEQDTYVPFKEQAIKSAIIGASIGNVMGEYAGGVAWVGGAGYLGARIGQALGGGIGAAAGGAIGAGAAYLLERKVPIGKTLGAFSGFVAGGVVGGLTGSVIGGYSVIANSHLFQ